MPNRAKNLMLHLSVHTALDALNFNHHLKGCAANHAELFMSRNSIDRP